MEATLAAGQPVYCATVDELTRKLDVKARARDKAAVTKQRARDKAAVTKQRAKERATITRDRAIVEVRAHRGLAAAATAAVVVAVLGAMVLWRRRS